MHDLLDDISTARVPPNLAEPCHCGSSSTNPVASTSVRQVHAACSVLDHVGFSGLCDLLTSFILGCGWKSKMLRTPFPAYPDRLAPYANPKRVYMLLCRAAKVAG
jgi:hypothetical protein